MAELAKAKENLERKGYKVRLFENGEQAAAYLNKQKTAR